MSQGGLARDLFFATVDEGFVPQPEGAGIAAPTAQAHAQPRAREIWSHFTRDAPSAV